MESTSQPVQISQQQQSVSQSAGDAVGPSSSMNPPNALVAGSEQAGPSTEVDRTKHPSGIVPVLQNLVATVNMDCKLELKTIAMNARNAEYNPKVRCCCQGGICGCHMYGCPVAEGERCAHDDHQPCAHLPPDSVLLQSSCAFEIPRPQHSSLHPAKWW